MTDQSATATLGTVLVVCPGGLENGGGIGRQMGYFLRAYGSQDQRLTYKVVDSRGPWFLGASPYHSVAAALYLMHAAATLAAARLSGSPCIAHVNITGRGSTFRKLLLLTLARVIGLRYLLHVHDPAYTEDFQRRGKRMRALIATMFRKAELVLVLGQRDKVLLDRLFDLPCGKTVVLHNAVPDPGVQDAQRLGRPRCQLLFLGYLSARKGVPELLHALASADLREANWHLTLAGGGPVDEFRLLASKLSIADRVYCPGWLDEEAASSACRNADILVLPSHAEGLAMAVLEGLAHGLAIVTTPVGAHCEVIDNDVSGILVPPGDVDALASALLRVINDGECRIRLQNAARQRYLEKFDVGPYASRLAKIHEVLLSSKVGLVGRTGQAEITQA